MKVSEIFEKLIDNGPGLIKAPKLNYDAHRSSQIAPLSKAELAARKEAVRKDREYQRELDRLSKKAREERLNVQPKKKKLDDAAIRMVANKIEEVIGNTWPDGDPIDWLAPWVVKTFGVKDWDITPILDKGARAISKRYKGYYDYLAKTWDDFAEDNEELLQQSGQFSNPWK